MIKDFNTFVNEKYSSNLDNVKKYILNMYLFIIRNNILNF